MASAFKFDLFISYSHENKEKVLELFRKLKQQGFHSWIDTEQMINGDINWMMKKGIDESELFLCCATTSYCKSENCLKEIEYAYFSKKKIVYVLFEKFNGEEDRKKKLDIISWYFRNQKYYKNDNVEDLVKTIETLRQVFLFMYFKRKTPNKKNSV